MNTGMTFVEVEGNAPTTITSAYGVNLEASAGCFNLVIPEQVCHISAMSFAEEQGFKPTGIVLYS